LDSAKAANRTPVGPAVIGGLVFATIATLFFVPIVFSYMHRNRKCAKIKSHDEPIKT